MTAKIPIHTISNTEFQKFLEKYTLHAVPSESTLRKTYINDCYDKCMLEIRQYILQKTKYGCQSTKQLMWKGLRRYIANVVVGTLLSDGPGKIFLLTTKYLKKPITLQLQNCLIMQCFYYSLMVYATTMVQRIVIFV